MIKVDWLDPNTLKPLRRRVDFSRLKLTENIVDEQVYIIRNSLCGNQFGPFFLILKNTSYKIV